MWIDKYKGHLDIKCAECGEELAVKVDFKSAGAVNDTLIISTCECQTPDPEQKLSDAIDEVQDANVDSEECMACGAKEEE